MTTAELSKLVNEHAVIFLNYKKMGEEIENVHKVMLTHMDNEVVYFLDENVETNSAPKTSFLEIKSRDIIRLD